MSFSSSMLFVALMLAVIPTFATDDVDQEVKATTLVQEGGAAADFTCEDITGRKHTLSALKGKVVVLYFFSSSNPASLPDLRYLESEIILKLGEKEKEGFQMLAIGRDCEREELVKISGEGKLTYPLVADPKQEIYRHYFTKFVPRTVVVRGDGTIAYQTSGANYENILKLQSVLAHELMFKKP